MKVGIITDMLDDRRTGVGNYTFNLLNNLFFLKNNNTYTLIHYRDDLSKYFGCKENLRYLVVKRPKVLFGSVIRKLFILPRAVNSENFDIIHDTYQLGPIFFLNKAYSTITTVYDLTPILFSDSNLLSSIRHKTILPQLVKITDKIITISNSTKNDLISYFNIPEEKIKVILLAVDEKFKPLNNEEKNEIRQKHNLDFPFILYVGTLEPRKNIPTLIKAFYKLKKKNINYKLVITGKKGWKYKEIFEIINKLNLQNDVVFTGYVLDEDLPALYNAADLFVYPSIYEGFGLPPLEAMACGTPVITSNSSSLPEVVGDAGIMVDPYDIDELADAMFNVLTNDGLREDMIRKGLERAKKFSWEKTAKETLEVYEEVYYER